MACFDDDTKKKTLYGMISPISLPVTFCFSLLLWYIYWWSVFGARHLRMESCFEMLRIGESDTLSICGLGFGIAHVVFYLIPVSVCVMSGLGIMYG